MFEIRAWSPRTGRSYFRFSTAKRYGHAIDGQDLSLVGRMSRVVEKVGHVLRLRMFGSRDYGQAMPYENE